MIKRNGFRAHRLVELTLLVLLLLSPLEETHAVDSTLQNKLRGKDNYLVENLSPEDESIDSSLIHVPTESGSIGLTSDQSLPMTLTSDTSAPNGESCVFDSNCQSGRCSSSFVCEDKLGVGESCGEDDDCESGRCSKFWKCELKLAVGDGCGENDDCVSGYCEERGSCPPSLFCCVSSPGALMPNNARCVLDTQCSSGRCSSSLICEDKLHKGGSCGEGADCHSGTCNWDFTCKGFDDGHSCGDGSQCESGNCDGTCYTPGPCFSSTSMVNHMSHGLVPISDINIGDHIQSNTDGSFSRVYAFKKNNHEDTEFYQLQSRTGTLLEVTDRHLVFLKNKSLPIAARDVRVGDVLKSDNPEDDTEVVKIELIHREGYYNPFTESGTFVLNEGVVASSYDVSSSSSSDFFDGPTEMIHWHTLAHFACAPLRFVCKTMNFDVCSDADNQNEDGLHKFIVFLTTLRKLKDWQQVAVLPVIFGAGVLFTLLEFFYDLGEAFYETISSTSAEAAAQDDGSFGFLFTFSLTVAALVPSAFFLWRKKYHLSCD